MVASREFRIRKAVAEGTARRGAERGRRGMRLRAERSMPKKC